MEQEPRLTRTLKETDRKCPNCGATLQFNPQKNGLSCAFCEYFEEIPTDKDDEGIEKSADELDLFSEVNTASCDWGVKSKVIICKSCGAESIYDELQIADICPYCGSTQVMQASEDVKTLAPGGVVPFQIDEKNAGTLFTKWIKGRFFCPKKAKQSARPDAFKGVYLPYWTYDAKTTTKYTARYGIDEERKDRDGNKHTHTEWYFTGGVQKVDFDDVLVLGSKRYDNDLMQRIEPFDTANNVRYQPKFLQGFTAERYSIGLKDGWETAKSKMRKKIEDEIKTDIERRFHADHVDSIEGKTAYADATYKYLLLPVWMSSFRYKNKLYRFLVNGQSGKVGGKAPVSAARVILVIAAILAAIIGLVLLFKACGN